MYHALELQVTRKRERETRAEDAGPRNLAQARVKKKGMEGLTSNSCTVPPIEEVPNSSSKSNYLCSPHTPLLCRESEDQQQAHMRGGEKHSELKDGEISSPTTRCLRKEEEEEERRRAEEKLCCIRRRGKGKEEREEKAEPRKALDINIHRGEERAEKGKSSASRKDNGKAEKKKKKN
jgi:hypothetical protein